MIRIIDCHCHLTSYERGIVEDVLGEAKEVDVDKIIGIPLDLESSRENIQLSEKYSEIKPAVGIHPHESLKTNEKNVGEVCELLENKEIVAAGEVGVDLHFLKQDTKAKQLKVFRKIMDKAINLDLPIILHCPRAEPLVYKEAKRAGAEKVIFHWYTGPHEILRKILSEQEYYISVTPAVIYSGKLQRIVEVSPLGKILLESDGPVEYRELGEGRPSHIPKVANKVAKVKNEDMETVLDTTTQNAENIFRI